MAKKYSLKLFEKSLWVFHLNTGSCNACDIEVVNIFTPIQDATRFGIKLVGSPRHADAILLTGPITREALPRTIRAIEAVPDPKILVAIGSCACGGGIWYDGYNIIGGVQNLYKILREKGVEPPPTFYVPGCPPKPEAILYAICLVRRVVRKKQKRGVYVESREEVEREMAKLAEELGVQELRESITKHLSGKFSAGKG